MKTVFLLSDVLDGDPVEISRIEALEIFGEALLNNAERFGFVSTLTHCLEVRRICGPDDKSTARALAHLSNAINHGSQAHRAIPEVSGAHHRPAVRIRADVQFHLSEAGRSLGRAYDSLRTLAEIINKS